MTVWRTTKLPLSKMFLTDKPGRSRVALSRRVDKLASQGCLDESVRLKGYLNLAVLAESLRAEKIPGAPAANIAVAAQAMMAEKVHLPPAAQTALVEHRTKCLFADGSPPATFFQVLKPWGAAETPFDPSAPNLACVETTFKKKCELYQKLLWRGYLVPMALGDMRQTEKLESSLTTILDDIAEEDVLELDMKEAVFMQESKSAASVLRSLLHLPPTGVDADDYLLVQARCGKFDPSILTSVANAIHNNPILSERLTLTVKALPVLAECGEKLEAYNQQLNVGGQGVQWFNTLTTICSDLMVLHSSPASALFLPLSEKVKEAILGAWANYASTPDRRHDQHNDS